MQENSTEDANNGISIGTHRVVISPPIGPPTSLAGYAGKKDYATGLKDNLYANSIIINNGEKFICFVACDTLGLIFDQVESAKEIFIDYVKKKDQIDIPSKNITISSTHTHNGPDLYGIYNPEHNFEYNPDHEYLKILPRYIAGSLIGAYNEMNSNCKIGWNFRDFMGFSYNRRGNLKKCEKDYRSVDTQFGAIKISDSNNKILALILSFTAHPTTTPMADNRITADYIYDIRTYLHEQYGNDVVILYLNGSFGDVSPRLRIGKTDLDIQVKIDDSTISLHNFNDLMINYGINKILNLDEAKDAWGTLKCLPKVKKQFKDVSSIELHVNNGILIFSNIKNIIMGMEAIRQFIIWSIQTYQRKIKNVYGEMLGKNFSMIIDDINEDFEEIDLDAGSEIMEYLVEDRSIFEKLVILKNSKFYFQVDDDMGNIKKCGFKISLTAIKIGKIIFLNVPAETINEISMRLRDLITKQSNIENTILISNSNGYTAYLVTPEESKQGGYEPQYCFSMRNAYNLEKNLIKIVNNMLTTNITWKKDFDYKPVVVTNVTEIDFEEL
jgi:neutral/alkaline ceramidase-like enzyme